MITGIIHCDNCDKIIEGKPKLLVMGNEHYHCCSNDCIDTILNNHKL